MTLSRRQILVSTLALAALTGLAMSPRLLGGRVAGGLDELAGADRGWLLVAALGFVAAFACTVASWRAGFAAAGGRVAARRGRGGPGGSAGGAGSAPPERRGVGALVNAFARAKLGDAVKVGSCSRATDGPGRIWTAGGVYAALAAARS